MENRALCPIFCLNRRPICDKWLCGAGIWGAKAPEALKSEKIHVKVNLLYIAANGCDRPKMADILIFTMLYLVLTPCCKPDIPLFPKKTHCIP
jgi:hypothetical protein